MIVTGNGAEVWPAGIVMVAGTVTRLVSLDVRLTTSRFPKPPGFQRPVTTPSPSLASAWNVGLADGRA